MELWSKSLWLRIVCPNVSHTSVSWILIRPERSRLKSKSGGGKSKEVREGGVLVVVGQKAKIGNMAKSEKYVLWCQGLFCFYHCLLIPPSLLPFLFLCVSLEACQLEPRLPPRELEGRGCACRGGRVTDRERRRWERGRVTGGLNNEVM